MNSKYQDQILRWAQPSSSKINACLTIIYSSKFSTDISHQTYDVIEAYQDEMLCLTDFLSQVKRFILTRDHDLTIEGKQQKLIL